MNIPSIYYQYTNNILTTYYQCIINIPSIYYQYINNIISIYHRYTIDILSIYYQSKTQDKYSKIIHLLKIKDILGAMAT